MKRILSIYVTSDCVACDRALEMARLADDAFPLLDVNVVEMSSGLDSRPVEVTAAPTYVLDGQVIHLGNPSQGWLFDRLSKDLRSASNVGTQGG